MQDAAGSLSSSIAAGSLLKEQACYRPLSEDGQPVIGPVAGTKGAYVATGGDDSSYVERLLDIAVLFPVTIRRPPNRCAPSPIFTEQ